MELPGTKKVPVPEKLRSFAFATLGEELPLDYQVTMIEDLGTLQSQVSSEEGESKKALLEEMFNLQNGCLSTGEALSLRKHLRELIARRSGEHPEWMKLLEASLVDIQDETADELMLNDLLRK